jgi:AraC-like DNA-binding protein
MPSVENPLIRVQDIAFIRRRVGGPAWRIDNRVPDEWPILVTGLAGRAFYQVDGQRFTVNPGDLAWMRGGCLRQAAADPGSAWTFVTASFSLAAAPAFPMHAALGARAASRHIAEEMAAAWAAGDPAHRLLALGRLYELLHLLLRDGAQTGDPRLNGLIADLRTRPATAPLPAAALAKELGVSPSHFRQLFQTATGVPPHRWQNQRRLEHARDLLLEGESIAHAAASAGFSDLHYFSRLFRRHLGTTPSACQPG